MISAEPDLRDFRITPEQYALYKGEERDLSFLGCLFGISVVSAVGFMVGFSVVLAVTRDVATAISGGGIGILVSIFPPGGMVTGYVWVNLVTPAIARLKMRLSGGAVISRIKLYEEAGAAYRAAQEAAARVQREAEQRRQEAERAERERQEAEQRRQQQVEMARRRKLVDYWMALSGVEFERELAIVFKHLGYDVQETPTSGDQGIDLVLGKNGATTIVQCKSHKSSIGPATARELLGSLVASGADNSILACTGGFTQGVRDFVKDKPIDLISAEELATLCDSLNVPELQTVDTSDRGIGKKQSSSHSQRKHKRRKQGDKGYSPVIYALPTCPTPGCGSTMVSRTGKRGRFWGCPRYPKCRGTRDIH